MQFTRNDQGIAGALKKIGSNVQGSTLNTKASDEMSHMMFGQSKLSGFSSLFATHPPLDERIRRIEPNWDGSYAQHSHAQNTAFDNEQVSGFAVGGGYPASQSASPSEQLSETGKQLISQLPPELVDIAREPYSARFIAFALIFDGSDIQREMIKSYVPLASQSTLLPG